MGIGFRAWDAAGNLRLDGSTLVGRIIGIMQLASGATGSLDVAKESGDRLSAVLTLFDPSFSGRCRITNAANVDDPDGSRIIWELDAGTGGHLIYGVF